MIDQEALYIIAATELIKEAGLPCSVEVAVQYLKSFQTLKHLESAMREVLHDAYGNYSTEAKAGAAKSLTLIRSKLTSLAQSLLIPPDA